MNGSLARNAALLAGLKACDESAVDIVVCPPYPYLAQATDALQATPIAVGAQNLSAYAEGAYTGEVSAAMLVDVGCTWVIVGHSERRHGFGDTDAVVAAKVIAALDGGLQSILCVGETLAQREAGEAEAVVGAQLDGVVDALGADRMTSLVVAYEPVWAIGTGRTATPEQAEGMHVFIRSYLAHRGVVVSGLKILYGGSVTAANAALLFAKPDIDGALVGGASLAVESFSLICAAAAAS